MANSHRSHRLERLFSKRKPAKSPRPAQSQQSSEPIFPQPSFIRPKSTRMMARDEVWVRTPSPSKLSLADSRSSLPLSFSEVDLFGNAHLEGASLRAGSLLERNEVTTPELQVLRHSGPISQPDDEFSASSHPRSDADHRMSPSQTTGSNATMPLLQRLDTPPASESEDSFSFESKSASAQPSALTDTGLPTPGPSPDMSPVSDSLLHGHPGAIGELNTDNIIGTNRQSATVEPSAATPNPKSRLQTSVGDKRSSRSAVLKEPTLDDFLNLSDDDIAEEQAENKGPECGALPPTRPSILPRERAASLLTLPSPFPSRPAMAAAIEAARIAARHKFDLIYVVNLWPEKDNGGGPQPQSTPTMWPSQALRNTDRMRGRFLAAYGLSTVKSPFRISTMVHKRILRTNGWIEYLNDKAEADDFACGYACAFYPGQYDSQYDSPRTPDSPAGPAAGPESMGRKIDRGIVFAAYRKPSRNSNKSEIHCDQEQLSSIYCDAEALIGMLIDTHNMANRLRNSGRSSYSNETGPLPANNSMKTSW